MNNNPIPTQPETLLPCPWCKALPFLENSLDPKWAHIKHGEYCVMALNEFGRGRTQYIEVRFIPAWNRRAAVTAPRGDVAQRRLEIALGYIKRAANRELPKLPCRVDEMTEREVAIFNVGAAAVGNLQFIARELDALPAAATSSPTPAESVTPEQLVYNVAQRDPRFRKYLIEQLTAMGDEQDVGPLRQIAAVVSDRTKQAAEEIAEWMNWRKNIPQIAHEQNIVTLTNMLSKYFAAAPADNDAESSSPICVCPITPSERCPIHAALVAKEDR